MEAPKSKCVNWVAIEDGVEFALRGRPNHVVLRELVEIEHCTHVITIQGERENCLQMKGWTEYLDGATWINIPLDNARPVGMLKYYFRDTLFDPHRENFYAMFCCYVVLLCFLSLIRQSTTFWRPSIAPSSTCAKPCRPGPGRSGCCSIAPPDSIGLVCCCCLFVCLFVCFV
jgi:hypothetical protein